MTDGSNPQSPKQGLRFLCIDSTPNSNVLNVLLLIERNHGTWSLIKTLPEVNDTHFLLNEDGTQKRQKPDAVLVGDIEGANYQQGIVEAMLRHKINTFIPFSRYPAKNRDLLDWPKTERRPVRIIGFGGEQNEANPLLLFKYGTQDAEKHFLDLEQAIRTPIQTKEGSRRLLNWLGRLGYRARR